MTDADVRDWLGKYFLIFTVVIGGYILLFAETRALPGMNRDQAGQIFQIIIPVLVGQLTIIWKWFGNATQDQVPKARLTGIPVWVVKWPPLLVVGLLLLMLALMVVGGNSDPPWGPSSDTVSATVTFVVTILNATTIFVVAVFFNSAEKLLADVDRAKTPSSPADQPAEQAGSGLASPAVTGGSVKPAAD